MPTSRDVVVIVNPVAGSGKATSFIDEFCTRLRNEGHRCTRVTTAGPEDLHRLVAEHANGETVIAVAGGDGSIRGALNGLRGRPNPLLLLPLGTENILAKQLRIAPNIGSVWRTFVDGHLSHFDLATVNGQPFIIVVGAGFDAEVVATLSRVRRGNITHFNYIWPIWRTLWRYPFPAIRVMADGEEVCNEPALVFVGNIPRYAAGMRILREARWDDGLLDVCIYRCRHRVRLFGYALWTWLRRHVEHRLVSYHQAKRVRLESESPLPIQSDGDPAGKLPADIEIVPSAVNLLVPPRD